MMLERLPEEKQIGHALEDRQVEWCVKEKVEEGWDPDSALAYCASHIKEGKRYTEEQPFPASDTTNNDNKSNKDYEKFKAEMQLIIPHFGKSDSLHILNREPTPLERCISARMDLYGEDEAKALKNCQFMFSDPLYRHVFTEGDAWKIGEALWKWEYAHSPKYRKDRERDANDALWRDIKIKSIIKEIQSDPNDPDYVLPDSSLVDRATRIFEVREEQRKVKAARADRESRLTVGDLFGKDRTQILAEQRGDQRDYGKTRAEILAEVKAQNDEDERKRRRRDESN